ncbi:RING finger protein 122-like [Pelobates fuscus]|uniref:RING finger protein 122-like n=1 Tax=Pelobates fuscus TaxID=191477 RepID=UPI002FE44FC7
MFADLHPLQKFNMTREAQRGVPLNLFALVFGAGFLLLIVCLIFCCYFFRLKHQDQHRRRGYTKITLKEKANKKNLVGQVCAVCLEEFKVKEELGVCQCNHAFHTKCLMKWLEVRNSCPMCNKIISGTIQTPSLELM